MTNLNPNFTPRYTEEQKAQIAEFLLAGNSNVEIAETMGVPYHAVTDVKRKLVRQGKLEGKKERATLTRPGELPGKPPVFVEQASNRQEAVHANLLNELRELRAENVSLKQLLRKYMT
jgi:transposase-like protein